MLFFTDDFINTISDSINLQNNLNRFLTWSKINLIPSNVGKCKIVSFTCYKYPIIFNYSIDNITLIKAFLIKELDKGFSLDVSFKIIH